MTVLADTGALYALIDRSDVWHARVREWWSEQGSRVVVPVVVLPELTYLLQSRIGPMAEEAFVRALVAEEFTLESLEPEDVARAADVMQRYDGMPLGFVDAVLVATAERLETRELLTTDRRHFGVVRPRHTSGFSLLP